MRHLKNLSSDARTRLGLRALLPLGVLGAACSTILGIEDIHSGPAPGTDVGGENATGGSSSGHGGSGGKGGSSTGGTSASGRGGSGGSSSGSAGKGGSDAAGGTTGGTTGGSDGQGGSANSSSGGKGGSGGRSAGGSGGMDNGGEAGAGGTSVGDPTVHGRVVNHWLRPIAGVTVTIGDASADTDSDGKFTIADVPATYDAQMVVSFKRYGNDGPQYGWVYEGLTRRDPTLEVYEGLPLRSGDFIFTPQNVPGAQGEVIGMALGGDYGNYERTGSGAVETSTSWYGPIDVTMHAHGLSWIETNSLPTSYTAYTSSSSLITLSDSGGKPEFTLDYTPNTVTTGSLGGKVTSPTADERSNRIWLRFTTNASIQIVDHYGTDVLPDFTYTVPTVPNASLTLSALEGDSYRGAAAVAHADDVTAGQSNVALSIPTPPTLVAPASGAMVTDNTTFSWSGNAKTYVWFAISEAWYEGVYVVTTRKQIKMPTFSNGFTLRPGDTSVWRVETHDNWQSVDDATGPEGFADEFGYSEGESPEGPRHTSGTYAISIGREIITP